MHSHLLASKEEITGGKIIPFFFSLFVWNQLNQQFYLSTQNVSIIAGKLIAKVYASFSRKKKMDISFSNKKKEHPQVYVWWNSLTTYIQSFLLDELL
jgi:hypothetical protein